MTNKVLTSPKQPAIPTPGNKWLAVGARVECTDDNLPDICSCNPDDFGQHGRSYAEQQANARLCAAAPHLLSVLQELEESADYWSEYDVPLGIVDRINAAISAATGLAT